MATSTTKQQEKPFVQDKPDAAGDIADQNAGAQAEISKLTARIKTLEADNATLRNSGLTEADAEVVKVKMASGLSREHAIEALRAQQAHDARQAESQPAENK
jgi:hypothetical protein